MKNIKKFHKENANKDSIFNEKIITLPPPFFYYLFLGKLQKKKKQQQLLNLINVFENYSYSFKKKKLILSYI